MRKIRWLVMPFLLVFLLGCGLVSGIQNLQTIKNAASTQLPILETAASTQLPALETAAATDIPALETGAPTVEGMIETQAAQSTSGNCTGTPTSGGLGVSVETAKTVLQMTQQFQFADGTSGNQPAVVATLTGSGATAFPDLANGFSAQFIGDPCNLNHIIVTLPRTDQSASADQGVGLLNIILAGTLPADVQLSFLTWASQNYSTLAVGSQQQATFGTMQFTSVNFRFTSGLRRHLGWGRLMSWLWSITLL